MTSRPRSAATVEWFGTTTFRVRHAGLDLFFDGYLDRLPGLDPVGLSVAEVGRARACSAPNPARAP
jgi:L-ascorbate metabolism protein UlaG (beta-lactamase superfamily)